MSASLAKLVIAATLVSGCAEAPSTFVYEMKSPLPETRNECEAAYLTWITAPRPRGEAHPKDPSTDPLYAMCSVAELATASGRYPRRGNPPEHPEETVWVAVLGDDADYIANNFADECDVHDGSRLCQDIESREWDPDAR